MVENVNMKLTSLLEHEGDRYAVVNGDMCETGDRSVSGEAGDKSVSGEAGEGGEASDRSEGGEAGDKSVSGEAGEGGEASDRSEGGEAGDRSVGGEAGDRSVGGEAGDRSEGGEAGDRSEGGEAGDRSEGGEDDKLSFNGVGDNYKDDEQSTSDTTVAVTTTHAINLKQGNSMDIDQEEIAPSVDPTVPSVDPTAPLVEETVPSVEETAPSVEETIPSVEEDIVQLQVTNETGEEHSGQNNSSIDDQINPLSGVETLDQEPLTDKNGKTAASEDSEVSAFPRIETCSEPLPVEVRQRASHLSTTSNTQSSNLSYSPSDKETKHTSNDIKNQTETHTQVPQVSEQLSAESPSTTHPATNTSHGLFDLLRRFWRPFSRRIPALTARSGLVMVGVVAISSIVMYVGLSYSGYNSVGGWSGGKALQDNEGL